MIGRLPRAFVRVVLAASAAAALAACREGDDRGLLGFDRPPADVTGQWGLLAFVDCQPGTICLDIGYSERYFSIEELAGSLTLVEFACCGSALGGGNGFREEAVLSFDLDCVTRTAGECQVVECDAGNGTWNGTEYRGELFRSLTYTGPADACPAGSYNNRLGFVLRSGWGACAPPCGGG
jgi:hypothetical protein